jgi:anti-sigma regulatory factor (Ser/Thr protein kinase)
MLDSALWLYREGWPPDPTHVADARHFVQGHLRDHGLSPQADVVLVVVSELVTNAVLYSGGPFSVSVGREDQTLTLSVRDASHSPVAPQLPHRASDLGGRGLQIVALLSSAWGVTPEPDGKSVWARFELPEPVAGQRADQGAP